MAQAIQLQLKEGDPAPEFSGVDQNGKAIALRDYKGKYVVLYFYPKDDTPGCTKEACAFRDNYAAFQKEGVIVLGVSTDPPQLHAKFVSKYNLPFTLVADPEKAVVQAYGVWGQKSFMGRKYMGTHRITFLIGPDGRIRRIWPPVKPIEHAREVLGAIARK